MGKRRCDSLDEVTPIQISQSHQDGSCFPDLESDKCESSLLLFRGDDSNSECLSLLSSQSEIDIAPSTTRSVHKSDCSPNICEIWRCSWLPEGPWGFGKQEPILETEGVKLLKFLAITCASLLIIHYYAILMNATRDTSYTLREMFFFDGNHILLDSLAFFLVGRLYKAPSVDTLQWIFPSLGVAILQSILATGSDSLNHSITPYEMHCSWTWQFRVLLFGVVLPALFGLVWLHISYEFRQGRGLRKAFELTLSFVVLVLPYTYSNFFHFHHWYLAWVLGMHANAPTWWSRLTMCMLWGMYINGIGIFGRDPIMTCAFSLYQSQSQECPYVDNSTGVHSSLDALEAFNENEVLSCN